MPRKKKIEPIFQDTTSDSEAKIIGVGNYLNHVVKISSGDSSGVKEAIGVCVAITQRDDRVELKLADGLTWGMTLNESVASPEENVYYLDGSFGEGYPRMITVVE